MKVMHLPLLWTLGVLVTAQSGPGPSLSGLPICAQNAALAGASNSGCALSDAKCFCSNAVFVGGLQGAISTQCSGNDQIVACEWGNQACSQYGISLPCLSTDAVTNAGQASSGSSSTSAVDGTATIPTDTNASSSAPTIQSSPAIVTGSVSTACNATWSSSSITTQTRENVGSQYTGTASSAMLMRSNIFAILFGAIVVVSLS